MTNHPHMLVIGAGPDTDIGWLDPLRERWSITLIPPNAEQMPSGLQPAQGDAALILNPAQNSLAALELLSGVLDFLSEGLAVLDTQLRIRLTNQRFRALRRELQLASREPRSAEPPPADPPLGLDFFACLGEPEILGPDFCPFNTALATGLPARTTLRAGEKTYIELQASVIAPNPDEMPQSILVLVRDISADELQRQKLNAIHQAGSALGELAPADLLAMTVEDRVELLKQKIVQFTKDVLEFETVEVRLLHRSTGRLDPLLNVGMSEEAAARQLFAEPHGNGVTGFVAATGKSYLCEDITSDPLYLPGAPGARSSLTVPLILHDEVLGTFNVESAHASSFNETDLQFLELFAREVALALNTLELLVTEKLSTATESTELILREIARPVDEIINDTAWILERYIGHDPNVAERLQRVLRHTRGIRQLIHKVGESIRPQVAGTAGAMVRPQRPKLKGRRLLVVDHDETVRQAAHDLLGTFECEVETAHNGEEALLMVRSFAYDAVMVDIRLPDMTGFDCFTQIRSVNAQMPVILVTGFGYDPSHSIVKARQAGLKSVLYKPFRLDQLLAVLETTFTSGDGSAASASASPSSSVATSPSGSPGQSGSETKSVAESPATASVQPVPGSAAQDASRATTLPGHPSSPAQSPSSGQPAAGGGQRPGGSGERSTLGRLGSGLPTLERSERPRPVPPKPETPPSNPS